MYKVEEFFGKPEELEEYLNKKCVVEHLTISQIVSPVRNSYSIIFYDRDESKKKQILLDYAKENLCKKCLTCANFAYFCRGGKESCDSWEEDINAYQRLDQVV